MANKQPPPEDPIADSGKQANAPVKKPVVIKTPPKIILRTKKK
jgi:hypothetical protein